MTPARSPDAHGADALVCADALGSLVEQLGEAAAIAFVNRFVGLWPTRCQRLHLAVEHRDSEQGRDAALSLSSGATMAGANRLATLALRLHGLVPTSERSPAWSAPAKLMDELDRLGEDSVADVAHIARRIFPGSTLLSC